MPRLDRQVTSLGSTSDNRPRLAQIGDPGEALDRVFFEIDFGPAPGRRSAMSDDPKSTRSEEHPETSFQVSIAWSLNYLFFIDRFRPVSISKHPLQKPS
jgi:hypothetical protein